MKHAADARSEEIIEANPTWTEEEAYLYVAREIEAVLQQSVQQQVSPGEQLYAIAVQRFGWKGNGHEESAEEAVAEEGNGKPAEAAPKPAAKPKKKTVQERLGRNTQSLGKVPGSAEAQRKGPSPQDLATASPEDALKLLAKYGGAHFMKPLAQEDVEV